MPDICFNSFVDRPFIMRPVEIYEVKEEHRKALEKCFIYIVASRPKAIFSSQSLTFDSNILELNFHIKNANGLKNVIYRYDRAIFGPSFVDFQLSKQPHEYLILRTASGLESINPLATFIHRQSLGPLDPDLKSVKILYIGQSFVGEKSRNVIDRLLAHSNLQKILATESTKNPDSELLLYPLQYKNGELILKFGGNLKENSSSREIDLDKVFSTSFPMRRQTAITEAALIRYFQPTYNTQYKHSFPSTNQKILNECYRLNFSAVAVELQAEELGTEFYSDSVKPIFHHVVDFNLHGKGRGDFFKIR